MYVFCFLKAVSYAAFSSAVSAAIAVCTCLNLLRYAICKALGSPL